MNETSMKSLWQVFELAIQALEERNSDTVGQIWPPGPEIDAEEKRGNVGKQQSCRRTNEGGGGRGGADWRTTQGGAQGKSTGRQISRFPVIFTGKVLKKKKQDKLQT